MGIKKEDNDSDSNESESSTDENYQKVINNDDWDINMQRKIDEAYASTEMPAQLDQRFVKQPQEVSKIDVEMKDIEKSKHGSIDESTSNQEEEMGSDVSLNDDEFNNLLKELETHDPEDLTEEMKAKLAEAQKLKKEKIEKYLKNQDRKKKEKKKEKKKKGKEKTVEITAMAPSAPSTPGKVTNRNNISEGSSEYHRRKDESEEKSY